MFSKFLVETKTSSGIMPKYSSVMLQHAKIAIIRRRTLEIKLFEFVMKNPYCLSSFKKPKSLAICNEPVLKNRPFIQFVRWRNNIRNNNLLTIGSYSLLCF